MLEVWRLWLERLSPPDAHSYPVPKFRSAQGLTMNREPLTTIGTSVTRFPYAHNSLTPYRLNGVPSTLNVETKTPSVLVFGDGASEK